MIDSLALPKYEPAAGYDPDIVDRNSAKFTLVNPDSSKNSTELILATITDSNFQILTQMTIR